MVPRRYPRGITRREFLYLSGAAVLAAACGPATSVTTTTAGSTSSSAGGAAGSGPEIKFREPTQSVSGDLRILLWSHFVPAHDDWFDPFAKEWGEQVGVNVTIDHINQADLPAAIAADLQSNEPQYDMYQYIAVLSQHEPSVVDMKDLVTEAESRYGQLLDLCRRSSYNPNTGKYYAYCPAWVPDPGCYRRSLWETAGKAEGPTTWDDLIEYGGKIYQDQNIQLGIGMSQEIDSNMAMRALMWSFGASIQDASEQVVINSDETIAALEYMKRLYDTAMTPEVFSWNAASNNQGLNAGQLSYILNSISAYRTAQDEGLEVADDIYFSAALAGPVTALVASHVMYNWIIPDKQGVNVAAAQEFLLHYTENLAAVCWNSKLYDFPAFPSLVPDLDSWLDDDPFGSNPPTKLQVLKNATDWATNIGHPGPANPAVGQIFSQSIIPVMFAEVAQEQKTPAQALADAEAQINAIFADWRSRGLVGG